MRLLLLLALLVPLSATAQAPDVKLDTLVVTASRTAQSARQTGRRVTVLTAEAIAALPVASFDELLRTVGGVEVQSRGGFGVQSDLTLRGSSFNGVLVLLDGARLNDPMTGHFLSDFPVPLSEIARIEVLRGPASALYGPDALGGVIQLFTYTGLSVQPPAGGVGGQAEVQAGTDGLFVFDGSARVRTGKTLVGATSALGRSDGAPIHDADGNAVIGTDGPVRTDFQRQTHTLALARPLGGATWFVRGGVDRRDFGAYHFYTAFASDTAREATTTLWAQTHLSGGATSATTWQLRLAARQHDDEYVYNPQTPANEHTSRLVSATAEAQHAFAETVRLSGGVTGSLRSIDSNNLGQHDDAHAGVFALLRLAPADGLTAHVGGRVDGDTGFGVAVMPQASVAYTNGPLTLRAAAGRAVRAPNYVERYFNTTLARPRGRSLGNPDLRAERAWSVEAGADVYAGPLAVHATAFRRHTRDLIDYTRVTPADTVWLARNLLDVTTRGVELDATARTTLAGAPFFLAATYTWLDADLGSEGDAEYKYALTNARHLVQSVASLDVGAFRLGLQALWKERLTDERYTLLHARAGYRVPLWQGRLRFTAELRNLLDTDYADVFDAPMPGRTLLVGVRLTP